MLVNVYYNTADKEILTICGNDDCDFGEGTSSFSIEQSEVPDDIQNYKANSSGDGFEAKNIYAGNYIELTTDATDSVQPFDGIPDIPADAHSTCMVKIEIKKPDGTRNTDADCTVILSTTGGSLSEISVDVTGGYDESATLKSSLDTIIADVKAYVVDHEQVVGEMQIQFTYSQLMYIKPPHYDSGWVDIDQNETITLDHNIGGNVDDYLVHVRWKSSALGIHHVGYGSFDNVSEKLGGFWKGLTNSQIKVERQQNDTFIEQFRVRIWVY